MRPNLAIVDDARMDVAATSGALEEATGLLADRRHGQGGAPVILVVADRADLTPGIACDRWRSTRVGTRDVAAGLEWIRPDVLVAAGTDPAQMYAIARLASTHARGEWVPTLAVLPRPHLVRALDWGFRDSVALEVPPSELRARIDAALRHRDQLLALVRANRTLDELAGIDALTDLANRRRLDEQLRTLQAMAWRRGETLGVLVVDIDRFKEVNDRHGHATGDEVLRRVARVLRADVRVEDVLGRAVDGALGRWAGDEFVIGFAGVDDADLRLISQRLCDAVAAESTIGSDGTALGVTISVGGAASRDHEPWAELLKHADRALYAAKASGRNRAVITTVDADGTHREPREGTGGRPGRDQVAHR